MRMRHLRYGCLFAAVAVVSLGAAGGSGVRVLDAVKQGNAAAVKALIAQKADVMRELRYYRKLHGMAGSRTAAREWCAPNRIRDRVDLSRAEDAVDDRKALRVDLFGEG